MKSLIISLLTLALSISISAQNPAKTVTTLTDWQFAKRQPEMWTRVTLPHSCNADDGHSAQYYRGKAYYRYLLNLSEAQAAHPLFLHFEMAGQASTVSVNGTEIYSHRGGYTPFTVSLSGKVKAGENEVLVMCDNTEDSQLAPVSSDFNKNNGLYGTVSLLEMDEMYFSPYPFGQYREHIQTPSVSEKQATAVYNAMVVNSTAELRKIIVTAVLKDRDGGVVAQKKTKMSIAAGDSALFSSPLQLKNPHLWNGLEDPYLYTAGIELSDPSGKVFDAAESKIGFRYFSVDPEVGFVLNGKPYSLRGVSVHQDWDGRATAMNKEHYDLDYEIIKELGANFLRLAHYPHCDYAFQKCDELGILVQTEVPWVNICGERAEQRYFDNLHQQMNEMITNLYNHPSIICWGMWNELDFWGNNDQFQGKMDPARVVSESDLLYDYAKSIDPSRLVGMTDDSNFGCPGYEDLKGDYYSENKYCGWYYGEIDDFIKNMNSNHEKMGVVTVSEYGCGINPFCHSENPMETTQIGTGGSRHDEEFGNLFHESYLRQILRMPFLFFTSSWVMFDFAVANRFEGYMDTDDGVTFTESDFRKFTNDKGFVTRDRKVKKDIFYMYKSLWNKGDRTVYITSRRYTTRPGDKPVTIKVYSNAPELTLYHNGSAVETLRSSGEETGVIWTFKPVSFQSEADEFKVVSSDGVSDTVIFKVQK